MKHQRVHKGNDTCTFCSQPAMWEVETDSGSKAKYCGDDQGQPLCGTFWKSRQERHEEAPRV